MPAAELEGVRLLVSPHAVERARDRIARFPVTASNDSIINWIYYEVQDALRNGRKCKTEPSWIRAQRGGRRVKNPKGRGHLRYVYDARHTVAFLLLKGAPGHGDPGSVWIVKTVLVP